MPAVSASCAACCGWAEAAVQDPPVMNGRPRATPSAARRGIPRLPRISVLQLLSGFVMASLHAAPPRARSAPSLSDRHDIYGFAEKVVDHQVCLPECDVAKCGGGTSHGGAWADVAHPVPTSNFRQCHMRYFAAVT